MSNYHGVKSVVLFLLCSVFLFFVSVVGFSFEYEKTNQKPVNTRVDRIDFTGTWILDIEASRSKDFDEIMAIQGLNRAEIAMANITVVTQIISQDNNALYIDVRTPFLNRTEIQYTDGRKSLSTNLSGKAVNTITIWNDDKSELITKADLETRDGKTARLEIIRKLSQDHKTMYLINDFHMKGQKSLHFIRVFHRNE